MTFPQAFGWRAKTAALGSVTMLLSAALSLHAQEIHVAAAADLEPAMAELSQKFTEHSQTRVIVTYGSSGNFFSQMQNGAPFDLFFSADIEYPKKLEAAGLAVPGTLYEYAVGRIVIWMPASAEIDVTKRGWDALLDASVEKIAIANPAHAPYGRAAVAALQRAGVYESVKAKLVYGENISQAAQFVQSGNAQAGILAMSLAVSPALRGGKRWDIPADMHPPLEQAVIILKSSKNKDAAHAFLDFLKSGAGRTILSNYGFEFPMKAK